MGDMDTTTKTQKPVEGPYYQTDRRGRRYPTYICRQGHWHRGRLQAVKCNRKHRESDS